MRKRNLSQDFGESCVSLFCSPLTLTVLKLSRLGWCFTERSHKWVCIVNPSAPYRTPTTDRRGFPTDSSWWTQHIKFSPRIAYTLVSLETLLSFLGGRLDHVHLFPLILHILSRNSSLQVTSPGVPVACEHPKATTIISGEWFDPESCRIWTRWDEVALGIRG